MILRMKLSLFFAAYSLAGSSVNCSYFFGKFFYNNGDDVKQTTFVVPVSAPPSEKTIVFLDESVDPDRHRFELEMQQEQLRANQIKAAKLAYYIDSLPKESDSMEMISNEASWGNIIKARLESRRRQLEDVIIYLAGLKYGHDQYSESESETESSFGINLDIDDSSSSDSDSDDDASTTTQDMLDLVIGKADPKKEQDQEQDQINDDTYELIGSSIDNTESVAEDATKDIKDID